MSPLSCTRPLLPFVLLGLAACSTSSVSSLELERAALPASASAPSADVARILALGAEDNRVQEHLHALTYEIGPRLTGSHGLMRAERWCRDQFAAWGLEARLEPWGEFAVGFDRGARSGSRVSPDLIELVFTTPAWSPGTDGPVRAPARLLAADADADTVRGRAAELGGAWVVRPRSTSRDREARAALDEALVAAGVAGVIDPSRDEELVHTGGSPRIEWDALPELVRVVLRGDQHEQLVADLTLGEEVELEFDIDNRFFEGPVPLYNVVADLVGSTKPDEYVIVCGHLDSWDGAQGAVDNGTGCSTAMEAARLLVESGARPERTIRFILWSGEEQGLLGSRAYVEANADILPRVSAVLNHDGGTNYLAGLGVTPEMMPTMREVCAPLFELDADMPFELRERDALSGAGSSDHAPFVQAGVPGFFWIQEGRSDYDRHHHTQYDTFDAAIPAYQEFSSLVVATVALGLANQPELLDRRNMAPIAPRRMGVQLDGLRVRGVSEGSKAAAAGWREGDEIVSLDGTPLNGRRELQRGLQAGAPKKTITLRRGEELIETVLDWSGDPAEEERARRRAERARMRAR